MKRLWGIRHIRWLYHAIQLARWVDQCQKMGLGIGIANEADIKRLDKIWNGEA